MKKLKAVLSLVLALVMLCGSASAVSLKEGSYGLDSLVLNMRLNVLGYDTDETSATYDEKTSNAISIFQMRNGLTITGAVDDETWNVVFSESYRLGIDLGGLASRDYYILGDLTAPFSTVEVQDNSRGLDFEALMKMESFECWVSLQILDSMDGFVASKQEDDKAYFNENFISQYSGTNFRIIDDQNFEINGKPARVWSEGWDFVNGTKLNAYVFRGIVELDQVEGKQMYATVLMNYNLEPAASTFTDFLGTDAVKNVLSGIRCDRDRLADFKAGEADRKKASKLKLTLPKFQPVDPDEQSILEMLYTIRDNVDPTADGLTGKLDGDTCVSMYYGVKIMEEYAGIVANGNTPGDARMLCLLSLANGAFDNGFIATAPKIRNRLNASLKAAKLALTKDAAPYLVLLGIETPSWTAEELDAMSDELISALDRMIDNNKEDYTASDYEPEVLYRGEWMLAPTVEVTQTGEGEVTLTWAAVPGADPESYQVLEYVDGSFKALKTVKETTVTLSDVSMGTHTYAVRSRKKFDGEWLSGINSAKVSVTVAELWKQAPVIESITQTGEGEITLVVSVAPGAEPDSYQVLEYADGSFSALKTVKEKVITLSGVSMGTHTYLVRPKKKIDGNWENGKSSEQKSVTVTELWKQPPTIAGITQTGEGEVTLVLAAIPGSGADSYQVLEYVNGAFTALKTVKDTIIRLNDVSMGTHTYAVRPKKKIGENWENGRNSEQKTIEVTEMWKLAPTIVSIRQTGAGEVTLIWTAAPGAKPDSYQVLEYADGKYTALTTVKETTVKLNGVSVGTHTYVVRPRKKVDGNWESGKNSEQELVTVQVVNQ